MLYILFFFFYGYGHHRDLHSFPTRRSSDLTDLSPWAKAVRSAIPAKASKTPASLELVVYASLTKDRKSTRLNSSHTVISYAVFCLKKKKKKKNINTNKQLQIS